MYRSKECEKDIAIFWTMKDLINANINELVIDMR